MVAGCLRREVTLLLLVAAASGCGGGNSNRDAAIDHPASAPDGPDASGTPLLPACGGTVHITGTTSSGPFTAKYVFASYTACGGVLVIDIAQADSSDSGVFQIELTRNVQTNSYVGPSTRTATYIAPGATDAPVSLQTAVDITAFPGTVDMNQDGGRDPVEGTINIDTGGVSITGDFSSRLCGVVVACG